LLDVQLDLHYAAREEAKLSSEIGLVPASQINGAKAVGG